MQITILKKPEKTELKELKIAGIIIGFALLTYVSPYVWNRYDNSPVSAANEVSSNGIIGQPKPEYVVKDFFYQIDSNDFSEALSLMDPLTIKYSSKIWREDFTNIYFIKLRNLEVKEEKNGLKTYLVRLDVRLKGSRLRTSWENGENKRIVALKLVDNQWKISDIMILKTNGGR